MSGLQTVQLAVAEIERYSATLIAEIESLSEDQLWSREGGIPNSVGTLTLHLTGNLNHYFGAEILKNGYVRKRDLEFSETDIPKAIVIADLQAAVKIARQAVDALDEARADQPYTAADGEKIESLALHLVRMSTHFVHHCGQADFAKFSVVPKRPGAA
ncbi:MAG TPA: DinB family protein [Aggregatilineales bacterium]|nr:DinB family protein [Aggregatilineales bacterium]